MSPATSLAVQVADLQILLECGRRDILEALLARYQRFVPASAAPDALRIELRVTPAAQRSELWDCSPTYADRVIRLQGTGYAGCLDLRGMTGSLDLHSAQPIEEIDYFLRIAYAWLSFTTGGMLFHAAGVRRDGQAYVFFGPSGSGKTTAAQLSADFEVLNDDLLLLAFYGGKWRAASTPFTNPSQVVPQPGTAPLSGLYRLVKDEQVFLEQVSSAGALAEVLSCIPLISSIPGCIPELVERCSRLVSQIAVQRLHFRKDASFWSLLGSAA